MKNRRNRAKLFAPLAVFWLLAACGPPEQPPFEVRNELDQLVVDFFSPPEQGKYREMVAEREGRGGVVGATGQFLLKSFPKGTPMNRVAEYFEGIGGTCRAAEGTGDAVICEYCRNRNLARRYIIDTAYDRLEVLWIVEVFGAKFSESTSDLARTRALAYTVAKRGHAHGGHSGPADIPATCEDARYRLEHHQGDQRYGEVLERHWAYGELD